MIDFPGTAVAGFSGAGAAVGVTASYLFDHFAAWFQAGWPYPTLGSPALSVALPQHPARGDMNWSTPVLAVLTLIFGGGWLATWIRTSDARKNRRDSQITADIRAAQECLQNLRQAYRLHLRGGLTAPDDSVLADLADELETAANRTLCDVVVERARAYIDVGNLYVAGDPDTGVGAEEKAHQSLSDALRKELKLNR